MTKQELFDSSLSADFLSQENINRLAEEIAKTSKLSAIRLLKNVDDPSFAPIKEYIDSLPTEDKWAPMKIAALSKVAHITIDGYIEGFTADEVERINLLNSARILGSISGVNQLLNMNMYPEERAIIVDYQKKIGELSRGKIYIDEMADVYKQLWDIREQIGMDIPFDLNASFIQFNGENITDAQGIKLHIAPSSISDYNKIIEAITHDLAAAGAPFKLAYGKTATKMLSDPEWVQSGKLITIYPGNWDARGFFANHPELMKVDLERVAVTEEELQGIKDLMGDDAERVKNVWKVKSVTKGVSPSGDKPFGGKVFGRYGQIMETESTPFGYLRNPDGNIVIDDKLIHIPGFIKDITLEDFFNECEGINSIELVGDYHYRNPLLMNPKFSDEQISVIKMGLDKGIDVTEYANPDISVEKMGDLLDVLMEMEPESFEIEVTDEEEYINYDSEDLVVDEEEIVQE